MCGELATPNNTIDITKRKHQNYASYSHFVVQIWDFNFRGGRAIWLRHAKEKAEEPIKTVYERGERYEKECTGCAQSSLAAVFETLELGNDNVFKAASGMVDGFGLSGDGSCGVLSGGAMAIGTVFGRDRQNFNDPMAAMTSYLLVNELHQDFMDRYGTCRCHDIQHKLMGRTFNLLDANQMKEAFEFGMMEHCSKVVGNGADKAVGIILKNQAE
ncbi:MAG: C_GCAxxG_C_C family protein [Proteobacteria bacterium]|nr:C_GCAxxG_C_C family protein [Pseudomonadota bacterium]